MGLKIQLQGPKLHSLTVLPRETLDRSVSVRCFPHQRSTASVDARWHVEDLALQQRHLPIFSLLASYGAMATEDTKDMDLLQSCARGHVESISSLDLRWFWGR